MPDRWNRSGAKGCSTGWTSRKHSSRESSPPARPGVAANQADPPPGRTDFKADRRGLDATFGGGEAGPRTHHRQAPGDLRARGLSFRRPEADGHFLRSSRACRGIRRASIFQKAGRSPKDNGFRFSNVWIVSRASDPSTSLGMTKLLKDKCTEPKLIYYPGGSIQSARTGEAQTIRMRGRIPGLH
jgi:hypothetical protein